MSCAVYWYYYDKCQNSFISRIYAQDKYGVVITYCVISMLRLYDDFTTLLRHSFMWTADSVSNVDQCQDLHLALNSFSVRMRSLGFFTIIRMLCFNFIFKHNTSKQLQHIRTHLGFVSLLGICSIPSIIVASEGAVDRSDYVLKKIRNMLLFGIIFQKAGWHADWVKENNMDPTFWNFVTMFFEALCIEETILSSRP